MSLSEALSVLSPSLTGKVWSGLAARLVEELRFDRRRLLADDARQRRALGAVALARGAQAAEQVHLQAGGFGELVGRQLGAALIEVVGDAHRPDRVRARRPGSDLVELVERRHHRPLGLLDDVQILGKWRQRGGRRRRGCGHLLFRRRCAASDHGGCAEQGAAHHECPAIETLGQFRDARLCVR